MKKLLHAQIYPYAKYDPRLLMNCKKVSPWKKFEQLKDIIFKEISEQTNMETNCSIRVESKAEVVRCGL